MTRPNDGGPAFPQQLSYGQRESGSSDMLGLGGMSLRDWFAGQALTVIQRPKIKVEEVAILAYQIADAMLEEGERHK